MQFCYRLLAALQKLSVTLKAALLVGISFVPGNVAFLWFFGRLLAALQKLLVTLHNRLFLGGLRIRLVLS